MPEMWLIQQRPDKHVQCALVSSYTHCATEQCSNNGRNFIIKIDQGEPRERGRRELWGQHRPIRRDDSVSLGLWRRSHAGAASRWCCVRRRPCPEVLAQSSRDPAPRRRGCWRCSTQTPINIEQSSINHLQTQSYVFASRLQRGCIAQLYLSCGVCHVRLLCRNG